MAQSSVLTREKMEDLFKSQGLKLSEEQIGKCFEALTGFYEEIMEAEKEKKKGNRGKTGYMLWLSENRASLKEELGGGKVTEVAKLGGERWKMLSEEEKSEWKDRARGMSVEERVKKAKWSFDLKNNEGDDEKYEGWSVENVGYFLEGKTEAGTKRGEGSFMRLSEAIDAANKLGNGCGGIVKGNSGYTLKLSGEKKAVKDPIYKEYIKCWVKEDLEGVATYSEKKSKRKVAKILKKSEEEEKVEEKEEEEKEEVKAEEIFKEDEEEEEDEDSENEEPELEEYVYKGKTYLLDENTNLVYDYDTQDEIGRKKGAKVIFYKK
jgi:hypothetical protein